MNRRVKMIAVALSLLTGASILSLSIWSARAGGGRALIERLSGRTSAAAAHGFTTTSAPSLAPTVTASKTDSLLTDVNGNGKADPGDTLKYTVTISATGEDATGVVFNDTPDANTTLVPGSVMTTPLARNDSYAASGNIQITIAAPGVLANDVDPDGVGPALTVSAGTTSANGGNLTLNANGGFTYNPPPGFEGADTFTYTLDDGEGNTDTATVTINVTGMIWFIDNSLGSNGDGRLSSPFNSLANFVSGAADDPGDNIFIYSGSGNYTGPLTLLNNQKLIGQGAGDTLSNITGVIPPAGSLSLPATGGARPVIAHSANNLTLASGNTLRGFNLSNTGGTALSGLNFGALTVSEVSVTNTNGTGIHLDNGTPNASFTSVNTSGGGNGIVLQNWVSGSFTITGSGGSCTAAAPTCTGGVIQNTTGPDTAAVPPTGAGIALHNVTNVSLNNVRVRDHSNYGIRGNNVTGFTLNNSLIDATGPGFNGDDPANDDGALHFTNLLGACGITGSDIRRGLENLLFIDNTSGSLTLNISNSNFQETNLSTMPLVGNAGIHLLARTSATMTVNVTNTMIRDVLSDCVLGRAQDNGALNLTVTGSSMLDSDQAIDLAVSQNADLTYDIQNNTMAGHTMNAVQVVIGEVSGSSSVIGKIINNIIGNSAVVDSGSEFGFGISMDLRGNGTSSTTIHNNVISHTDREGIILTVRGESSGSIKTGQHAMRITNNTINPPDDNSAFPFGDINGIEIETNNGQTFCLEMSGNNSQPNLPVVAGTRDGYRLRQRSQGAASVFSIQGLTPASGATAAQVEAYVAGQNPAGNSVHVVPASGTTIVAFTAGTCTTPAPLMAPMGDTLSLAARARLKLAKAGALPSFVKTVGDLLAAYGQGSGMDLANLSDVDLNYIKQAALVRLAAAGISGEEVARLARLPFQISDLPEGVLATASSAGVVIDVNAAGHGWYVDFAADDDEEFRARSGGELRVRASNPAFRQMDLLTAVMRQMLHVIGQEKERRMDYLDGLMSRTLATGARRLPSAEPERISRLTRPAGESEVNRVSSAPGASAGRTGATPAEMRRSYSAFPAPVAYTRPDLYFSKAPAAEPASNPASAMAPVSLNIGTLPAGKTITITFDVTINNPLSPATTTQVCNQGVVSGSNFGDVLTNDPDTAAPDDPTCTPLTNANLSVAKSAGSATVCAGGNITYTINFSNGGPDAAGNVTVSDATPANTTFVSASVTTGAGWGVAAPSPGGTGAITFSKSSVANGETAVFEIVVNVNSGVADNTVISNTATAASTTIDGNLADNTSSASVTAKQAPTPATVGADQTICALGTTAGLGGNAPSVGTGAWSVQSGGTGTFSDANDPNATFTHTGGAGPIVLRWTISNSPCSESFAEVTITIKQQPVATAGADQTICALGTTAALGGNAPGSGETGTWSVVGGGTGTFSDANDPNATFTHTGGAGPITLRWTVTNPPCAAASEDVIITITQQPVATAGPDQTIVPNGTSAPLGGNTPPSGATGMWSVVGGGTGTFSDANDPNATFTHTGGAGPITLRWTVTNPPCASASEDVIINVGVAPTISCPTPITVDAAPGQCGASVAFNVTATGVPTPAVVCKIGDTVITSPHTFPVGVTTVNCTASNGIGSDANCSFTVTVNNPNPVVTITDPPSGSIFAVGTPVNFTGSFTDAGGGTHAATWMFDNISQAGTVNEMTGEVTATYTFTEAGVYSVSLTVNDSCGGTGTATTVGEFDALVVVYDPSAGWVTGGGWINSPAGAYIPDPSLTGKANFGFVAKYQNGQSVPTGNTEFHFKAGDLKFKSTSYEWLVISGGKKAQFRGFGTINGSGNYRFMLTAIDGDQPGGGGQDKFRIRIWSDGGGLVYDNQMNAPDDDDPTTVLGGGSIVIHR